jgi:hypothetical protein
LDSRLEFASAESFSVALLQDKAVPELEAFSIALWVRVQSADRPGCILSYSTDDQPNLLRITSGPTLQLSMHGETYSTGMTMNASTWWHLTWTWTSKGRSPPM